MVACEARLFQEILCGGATVVRLHSRIAAIKWKSSCQRWMVSKVYDYPWLLEFVT